MTIQFGHFGSHFGGQIGHELQCLNFLLGPKYYISEQEAIHYAQLFLNRLIFLFFVEDTGKVRKRLFTDSILLSLKDAFLISEYSRRVCDTITDIFQRLDMGSRSPIEIFGFNGGLFAKRIPSNIFFNDLRDPSFFKEVLQYSTLIQTMHR